MQKNNLTDNSVTLKRLKILIRMDADHHVGLAHAIRVSRILSLGKKTFGNSWNFDIHLIGNLPQIKNFFGSDCDFTPLSADMGTEQDRALQVLKIAHETKADILLIDHPHLSRISWDIFYNSKIPLVAIDDEGGPVVADLIFNGTILDAYHDYPHMDRMENIHAGGKYSLINPCFRENSWTEPDQPSLLAVIGSGDRACDWAIKLTAQDGPLSKLDIPIKTMIVGAAYPKFNQLKQNCERSNIILHQGMDPLSLAKMMSRHTMGLITGGMIVYEALACGLPVIIFPQEKNLPPEAQYFSEKECAVNLGYEDGINMDIVRHEINRLMDSQKARLKMSMNGRQMIDGNGMTRVIETLDGFFTSLLEKPKVRSGP